MKGYGLKRQDVGCCPGHDKYSRESYKMTNREQVKRCARVAKAKERRKNKVSTTDYE